MINEMKDGMEKLAGGMRAIHEMLSGYGFRPEGEAEMEDSASSPLVAGSNFVDNDGKPIVIFPDAQRKMINECERVARGLAVKHARS